MGRVLSTNSPFWWNEPIARHACSWELGLACLHQFVVVAVSNQRPKGLQRLRIENGHIQVCIYPKYWSPCDSLPCPANQHRYMLDDAVYGPSQASFGIFAEFSSYCLIEAPHLIVACRAVVVDIRRQQQSSPPIFSLFSLFLLPSIGCVSIEDPRLADRP